MYIYINIKLRTFTIHKRFVQYSMRLPKKYFFVKQAKVKNMLLSRFQIFGENISKVVFPPYT